MVNVIPAPFRIEIGSGESRFHSGISIKYADPALTPVVERFCLDVSRRVGLQFEAKMAGGEMGMDDAPLIRIDVADDGELSALPATIGVSPVAGGIPDERYALTIRSSSVTLRAREPVGVARGLTTLLQLFATTPSDANGTVVLPDQRILDVPRFAWRTFSLDVARRFLSATEVNRLIDLLALYKINVLNMHFTDDQGWRLPYGRPANVQEDPNDPFYSLAEVQDLIEYAEERFITLVPEVDAPGHASAIMKFHPELLSGRNTLDFEPLPGVKYHSSWFDPDLPATFEFLESVWLQLATVFPSEFINIGGDEPFGMPHELYAPFIQHALPFVRSLGKRTVGWQESIRAGADLEHVIQYWITMPSPEDEPFATKLKIPEEVLENFAKSREDIETALAHSAPIIVSPHRFAYLDVPYAEPSADPAQEERRQRLGLRAYQPKSVAGTFNWEPVAALGSDVAPESVAGAGSAIWGETISDFDDLTFLVLPRLAGNAHKAWSQPRPGDWEAHCAALATHGRLWVQDGLTYFRSSLIPWT